MQEVKFMEHTNEAEEIKQPQAPEEGYTPRPAWQVWGARIALVLFLILVVYQIIAIARSGL